MKDEPAKKAGSGSATSTERPGRPTKYATPKPTPAMRKWKAELASCASRDDLEIFARERGYDHGWVVRVMAARRRRDWAQ